MQRTYYKIKYKNYNEKEFESIHTNLQGMKIFVNTLNNTTGIHDIKTFIITEIEKEITI